MSIRQKKGGPAVPWQGPDLRNPKTIKSPSFTATPNCRKCIASTPPASDLFNHRYGSNHPSITQLDQVEQECHHDQWSYSLDGIGASSTEKSHQFRSEPDKCFSGKSCQQPPIKLRLDRHLKTLCCRPRNTVVSRVCRDTGYRI